MAKTTLKKLETMIENLALSVKKGFDNVHQSFSGVHSLMGQMQLDIQDLKQGQEDILLRLDQHAYKVDVDDLKRRIGRVEKKIGI